MITHQLVHSETARTPLPYSVAPEFFPLPQRAHDPYFGLGRSNYYDLERRGLLRLIRVRKPGNIRGKVLVPFAETSALIRRLAGESEVGK